jgi:hypothetical protein
MSAMKLFKSVAGSAAGTIMSCWVRAIGAIGARSFSGS